MTEAILCKFIVTNLIKWKTYSILIICCVHKIVFGNDKLKEVLQPPFFISSSPEGGSPILSGKYFLHITKINFVNNNFVLTFALQQIIRI